MSLVALAMPLLLAGASLDQLPVAAEPTPPPGVEAPAEPVTAAPAKSADAPSEPEEGEELVVTGKRRGAPAGDPLVMLNEQSYAVTQAVDKAVIQPVASTYHKILPEPVRNGIRNFINNLREPVVFLNFLLQLKPGKAAETVGRFAINSTIGGGGLFDFARRKPFHLPRRPNGLANTLGFYGVKPGPFLFVPLVGPTSLRDFIGDGLDRLVLPLAVGSPFSKPAFGISVYVASSLDQRNEFDEKLRRLHEDSGDPYSATRRDYLEARQAAIDELRGKRKAPPPPTRELPPVPVPVP